MATRILNVPAESPLHGVPEPLKKRIAAAQSDAIEREFRSAKDSCARVFADLKIALRPPQETTKWAAADFGDKPAKELVAFYAVVLRGAAFLSRPFLSRPPTWSIEPSFSGPFTTRTR